MLDSVEQLELDGLVHWELSRSGRLWLPDGAEDPERILVGCFDKQLNFIHDDHRRVCAVCGRRAGKTVADMYLLLWTCMKHPGCHTCYGAQTRLYAKELMWRMLCTAAKAFFPGCKTNETELLIVMPNGSTIKLFGAKDINEADKARGFAYLLAILDEVEMFRDEILKYLLDEVLKASLADYRGRLVVTGTPDARCMGYLYDVDQGEKKKGWSHHYWTMLDNAMFPQWAGRPDWKQLAVDFIAQELAEFDLDVNDPWVQREYFGKWVKSLDAFILHIDDEENVYDPPPPKNLEHVLGIDLGFSDESAFVVNGFSRSQAMVYHLAEEAHPGMGMGEIVALAKGFIEAWNPIRTVVDPATGGASLIEELRRRYGVSIQYAEKNEKAAYFRLWNADVRARRYKFMRGSRTLTQAKGAQWNDKFTREREGIPFDLVDADLYSWRECYHFIPPRPPTPPRLEYDEEEDEIRVRPTEGTRRRHRRAA